MGFAALNPSYRDLQGPRVQLRLTAAHKKTENARGSIDRHRLNLGGAKNNKQIRESGMLRRGSRKLAAWWLGALLALSLAPVACAADPI